MAILPSSKSQTLRTNTARFRKEPGSSLEVWVKDRSASHPARSPRVPLRLLLRSQAMLLETILLITWLLDIWLLDTRVLETRLLKTWLLETWLLETWILEARLLKTRLLEMCLLETPLVVAKAAAVVIVGLPFLSITRSGRRFSWRP